jgi:hypothetical protein
LTQDRPSAGRVDDDIDDIDDVVVDVAWVAATRRRSFDPEPTWCGVIATSERGDRRALERGRSSRSGAT